MEEIPPPVAAIIERSCLPCHAGSDAPIELQTVSQWRRFARTADLALAQETMPPWLAAPACEPIVDSRAMPDAERDLLRGWLHELVSAARAKPTPQPHPAVRTAESSRVFDRGIGRAVRQELLQWRIGDDWRTPAEGGVRTFVISPARHDGLAVSSIALVPDEPAAIGSATFTTDTTGMARRLDAGDPSDGYEAMGDLGRNASGSLGGAGVGARELELPEPFAFWLAPDADIVVEAHATGVGRPSAGGMTLSLTPYAGAAPARLVKSVALGGYNSLGSELPDELERRIVIESDGDLVAVVPRGSHRVESMHLALVADDGSEQCLVNIPQWRRHFARPLVFSDSVRLHQGSELMARFRVAPQAPDAPPDMSEPPMLVLLIADG